MVDLQIDLPQSFLDEEEICGYLVTRQMKEVWAVELDLMAQLDRVCRENGLRYFAGAGTLLGAVRHHGFIPWDGDMDFYMLREDYNKLVSLANEFKEPYFLQNTYTEPITAMAFSRLRNSRTTAGSFKSLTLDMNNGIFIDIFPLDGISEDSFQNRIQKLKNYYYLSCIRNITFDFRGFSKKKALKRLFANVFISVLSKKDRIKYFQKYEDNLSKYSTKDSKMWGNRTIVFDCPKSRRPLEDWHSIEMVPFEFTEIPVPTNAHEILKQQYGDYMKIPSDKKSGKMHQDLIISTDNAHKNTGRKAQ